MPLFKGSALPEAEEVPLPLFKGSALMDKGDTVWWLALCFALHGTLGAGDFGFLVGWANPSPRGHEFVSRGHKNGWQGIKWPLETISAHRGFVTKS